MKQDPNELSALQWSIKIDGFPTGEQLYVFGEGHCLLWYSQQLIFPLFSFTSEATFRRRDCAVFGRGACGEVLKRTWSSRLGQRGERSEGTGIRALSPPGSHLFLESGPVAALGSRHVPVTNPKRMQTRATYSRPTLVHWVCAPACWSKRLLCYSLSTKGAQHKSNFILCA